MPCCYRKGARKIFGSSWLRPWLLLPKFLWAFVLIDPMNVHIKFEVRSFNRYWDNSGYLKTLGRTWIRRSGSSKVIDFGTSWKRVCDFLFLLVRHSNLGPILYRFGDIAGFCTPEWPHPYSTLILGVFPLHQFAHIWVSPHIGVKLFSCETIFEECQPMWSRYLNVTDRRTGGQTDRQYTVA